MDRTSEDVSHLSRPAHSFLDFPPEIRDTIYSFLFQGAVLVIEKRKLVDGEQDESVLVREGWEINISRSCKSIRYEIEQYLKRNCVGCMVGAWPPNDSQSFVNTTNKIPSSLRNHITILRFSNLIPVRHFMHAFGALQQVQLEHRLFPEECNDQTLGWYHGQESDEDVIAMMHAEMQSSFPFCQWLGIIIKPLLRELPDVTVVSKGWFLDSTLDNCIGIEVILDMRTWTFISAGRVKFNKISERADHPMLVSRYEVQEIE